jgi:hypothetical protein
MALNNMVQELLGIPGTNFGLVKTKINEALQLIQDERVWSFQLQTGGWLATGLLGGTANGFLSPGTITVTPGQNTIIGDAAATAAWTAAAPYPPLLTQKQIRVPYYSLYNIIALGNNGTVLYATTTSPGSGQPPGTYTVAVVDITGPGTGATVSITVDADGTVSTNPTVLSAGSGYVFPAINWSTGTIPASFTVTLQAVLTIDRLWSEPPQVNGTYMVYQAYFAAPAGFKKWYTIRDTTNNNEMDWWSYSQADLGAKDAQRITFNQPSYVVPLGADQRPGSTTAGQMLYELWPHPISQWPYTYQCMANAAPLVNQNDTVPYPLTDELVKWRAYEVLYLWKESQKGDDMQRGSGANWILLMQAAAAEYQKRLKQIRVVDQQYVDLYFSKMKRFPETFGEPFATTNGGLNVGGF